MYLVILRIACEMNKGEMEKNKTYKRFHTTWVWKEMGEGANIVRFMKKKTKIKFLLPVSSNPRYFYCKKKTYTHPSNFTERPIKRR